MSKYQYPPGPVISRYDVVRIVEPGFVTSTMKLVEDPLPAEFAPVTSIEIGACAVPVTVNVLVELVAPW